MCEDDNITKMMKEMRSIHQVETSEAVKSCLESCSESALAAVSLMEKDVDNYFSDEETPLMSKIAPPKTHSVNNLNEMTTLWVEEPTSGLRYRAKAMFNSPEQAPKSYNFLEEALSQWNEQQEVEVPSLRAGTKRSRMYDDERP